MGRAAVVSGGAVDWPHKNLDFRLCGTASSYCRGLRYSLVLGVSAPFGVDRVALNSPLVWVLLVREPPRSRNHAYHDPGRVAWLWSTAARNKRERSADGLAAASIVADIPRLSD